MAQSDTDRDRKTGTTGGITRRSFLAKAGLTAGALGVAGAVPSLAASCGSSTTTSASSSSGGTPTVVRFVFAPDPVWCFMQDTGIVAKWEELYNFKLVNTTTFDETAWFIGGHADIASLGTYEMPIVAVNGGKELVAFGQYNMDRDWLFVRSDSPYQTMPDLVGKKVATAATGASMLFMAAMFKKQYGVDIRLGGGSYKMSVQEFMAMPASLEKGDFEMSMGIIDYEIPYMIKNQHRWMYPETPTAFEYYREHFDLPDKSHNGAMSNLWVTTPAWLDANPHAAEGFNLMWQEGVNAWWADKAGIIQAYPDLFTVTNDAEMTWFLDYLDKHDCSVKTVYMDSVWVEKEKKVFQLIRDAGFVPADTPDPLFKIMAPPANAPKEALPPSTTPSSAVPSAESSP